MIQPHVTSTPTADGEQPGQDDALAGPPDTPDAGLQRAQLLSYLLIGIAAIVLFVKAFELPASRWEPLGAGAFPQLVFGLLIITCALGILGHARHRVAHNSPTGMASALWQWVIARRLVVMIFLLHGAYLLLLPRLGFSWATCLFLLVAQASLAPRTARSVLIGLVLAVMFSFGLNLLFSEVFNVFLPRAST